MAGKMTEWPSKRGPIAKIVPWDGCKGDAVPLTVVKLYDFHEFGWHLGDVGLIAFGLAFRTAVREPGVRRSQRSQRFHI